MNKEKILISIVTPLFNEESVVDLYYKELTQVIQKLKEYAFEVILIDDGSTDETLNKLLQISKNDQRIRVIELSRNFGKEAALTAGIDLASGEATILMDADLEHSPETIVKMLDEWNKGFDIVLAQREDRSNESIIKRFTTKIFYKLFNRLSDIKIPTDVGEFRLMNRASINAVKSMPERERFMRGILSWVGFKHSIVSFKVETRDKGRTKFSRSKLWNFAIDGLVSFSDIPLRIWSYLGITAMFISLFFIIVIIIRTLLFGQTISGYPTIMVTIVFFGGIQLFSIGIIGEYLSRTYLESKKRPIYIVKKEH